MDNLKSEKRFSIIKFIDKKLNSFILLIGVEADEDVIGEYSLNGQHLPSHSASHVDYFTKEKIKVCRVV